MCRMKRKRSFRSKRPTKRRRRFTKRYRRYGRNRIRTRGRYLRVKRTIALGSAAEPFLRFSTVATGNFWQYVTPTLDSAMNNFGTNSAMNGVTNIAEYQALFEQYKLSAVKYTFRPQFPEINTSMPIKRGGR